MNRLALQIEYDGANFCGSQYQVGVRTVQQELERALSILAKQFMRVAFSGRTDSGVHAKGQVVHCDWPMPNQDLEYKQPTSIYQYQETQHTEQQPSYYADLSQTSTLEKTASTSLPDLWKMYGNLNGILPLDLSVTRLQWIPSDFHARFSATSRCYVYRILNRPQRSALLKNTHYFVSLPLDVQAMEIAASHLIGKHDFSAFKSTSSNLNGAICDVSHVQMLNLGEGVLELWIEANRFVYNMVRVIVGTLLEIGLGKRPQEDLIRVIDSKDRNQAGPTAPAWGLSLESVQYPSCYQLFRDKV